MASPALRETDSVDTPIPMHLTRLSLRTADVASQFEFYSNVLELPVIEQRDDRVVLLAGASELELRHDGTDAAPFYHFAFNIPENKLDRAIEWMKGRAPLVTWHKTGKQVVHFDRWNADAIYFFDPAGNIVEFIAHHTLDNSAPGDFSVEDILLISEIGLVADDVPALVAELDTHIGIQPYLTSSPVFTAVGSPEGFLICVQRDRIWLPTRDRAAQPYPAGITIRSSNLAPRDRLSPIKLAEVAGAQIFLATD